MPKTYTGLTWRQHVKAGRSLKRICEEVLDLQSLFALTYGKSSPVVRHLHQTVSTINKVRNEADNLVCRECDKKPSKELLACYFGQPRPTARAARLKRPIY